VLVTLNRALAHAKAKPLIRESEGLRLVSYVCPTGYLTVGYGHRVEHRQVITLQQAEAWLASDIVETEKKLGEEVVRRCNTNQLAALLSFAFTIRTDAWRESTMRRLILAGNMFAASEQFQRWNKGTINGKLVVLPGLTFRRQAERTLFDCARELN
jgi:lysozyme